MPNASVKCFYSQDQYKRERSEKIATVLAIVLSLFPWGVGMPVPYRWSLWGISLASVLYLVLTVIPLIAHRTSDPQKSAIAIGVLAFSFAVFWPVMSQQWKAEKAAQVEGQIRVSRKGEKTPTRLIEIGSSGGAPLLYTLDDNDPDPKVKMLNDAGLRIDVEDGEIKVTTPIRDRQGNLIMYMEKNRWHVTQYCLDKNYSDDSLEVLDTGGHVVFQMKLLADRVQLQGEWRDTLGNGVRLIDKPEGKPGSGIIIWHNLDGEMKTIAFIEAIFKYPSVNHWRELRGPNDRLPFR